ncbi:MAG: GDP-mannose-dependent alpha-(1-6)-phosphatidylinositol monomannoside mannosyltransferase [Nitrosomonadaceae bacterium]|nr:GDP-mannose-dependent alpha-(1-6)-phosphatidylinositol monomannoside mannosyltransferase [Nitrosomonadaceae bacterium]
MFSMRILFGCQFYAPSVGGVQEVMRQIAERLVARGHHVTVATTELPTRDFKWLNGVEIKEFNVSGNLVSGMVGEIEDYQEYVVAGNFDVIMIMAAQQWTFDALWPVLDRMKCRKVFVPCGFSDFYVPAFAKYFQQLPEVLRKINHLVFHSTRYRDIDFVRERGMEHFSIIPVGASEDLFNVAADALFKARQGIPAESFLFLTVGSFTGLKGHLELAKAFSRLELAEGQHATLILNGNDVQAVDLSMGGLIGKFIGLVRAYGVQYSFGRIFKKFLGVGTTPRRIAIRVNKSQPDKLVLVTDFPRHELTQAFMAADLFVFASNVEYSPLVLYESAASGTPFLSVNVGNAEEIARWTGAGVICPSTIDKRGYTRVNAGVLAQSMAELMQQRDRLSALGAAGRKNWSERFTWEVITTQYEHLFQRLLERDPA